MAQDLRIMDDTVNYSLFIEKFSHVVCNPKRYATYFSSKASIQAEQQHDASDDDSTWEFSASISHSSRSSSSTGCTSACTPAQEIIFRYRSGMSIETRSSSPSQYSDSESDSWEMSSPTALSHSEYLPVTPDQGIKARYRQSRYDALQNTYQEALGVARAAGLKRNAKVVCNRPGCRDTLANVVALMYHLHIHDIHDRQLVCPRCLGSFDGQRELSMHKCNWRSQPSRTSPLRETFRRVFTRFSL